MELVFNYMDFGGAEFVKLYSYFAAFGLVLAFVGAVDAILVPKIRKIDMTSSLKSVE